MDFNVSNLPEQLRQRIQWICWAVEVRPDKDGEPKDTKVPRDAEDPNYGTDATSVDSWASFETAVKTAREYEGETVEPVSDEAIEVKPGVGIGFCFDNEGLIAGVDLDNCRDPETGEIEEWAQDIVDELDSWTQISTSGTGLHVFVFGFVPDGGNRKGDIEMYDGDRFFAMTGRHLEGTPETIEQRKDALASVHEEWVADDEDQQSLDDVDPDPVDVDDEDLLETAKAADDGGKFERLWNGRTAGYDSHSEAVGALMLKLAFWTAGEESRMERLFKQSGLYPHPDKKGKLDRLMDDEVANAVDEVSDFYQPSDDEPLQGVELDDPGPTDEQLAEMLDEDDPDADEVVDDADGGDSDSGAGDGADGDSASSQSSDHISEWDTVRSRYRTAQEQGEPTQKIRQRARFVATRRLEEKEAHFATNEVSDHLYVYDPDEGIYIERGEPYVSERLVDELREQFTTTESNEITAQIKGRTYHHPDDFGGPAGHICVGNGILVVDRDGVQELIDHTPNHLFMSKVAADYDPDATCPTFDEFLDDVATSEEDRLTLQEFAGYSLMSWGMPYHKALFLVGPQASGKSTFLDVLRALLGDTATTSIAPQELVDNRFTAIKLWQAWANIRNDISAELLANIGKFKEIVAGDEIYVEDKNEKGFFIEPRAKHLYSANQLPEIQTDDDAFFRRIILVSFPQTVPRQERDEHLLDKLLAEKSGILNWAIEGLERLMEQGRFTGDMLPGETRETWDAWGDSISRFKNECLVKEPDAFVPKKEAYRAYSAFCAERNLPVMTQQKLTRELKFDSAITDGKRTPKGSDKRVRCYNGVRLDEEWVPDELPDEDDDEDDDDSYDAGLDSF